MSQLMCGLHAVEKDDKLCDDGGGLGLVSSWGEGGWGTQLELLRSL